MREIKRLLVLQHLEIEGPGLFEQFAKERNLKIHTHLFYTNHLGEPGGYKSSEKLNIDSAWEKWHELHQKGWTEVSHNYG